MTTTTKDEIETIMREKFPNENFIRVWWISALPGLGKQRPVDLFDNDPDKLLEYVKGY